MTACALVSLVSSITGAHYMYARVYLVQVHVSPVVYRFINWSIAALLLRTEFNIFLKTAGGTSRVHELGGKFCSIQEHPF